MIQRSFTFVVHGWGFYPRERVLRLSILPYGCVHVPCLKNHACGYPHAYERRFLCVRARLRARARGHEIGTIIFARSSSFCGFCAAILRPGQAASNAALIALAEPLRSSRGSLTFR